MSGLLFENNKHAIAKVRENANRHGGKENGLRKKCVTLFSSNSDTYWSIDVTVVAVQRDKMSNSGMA